MLGTVIATLKEKDNHIDDNFLVIGPNRKNASSKCGSALHSNEEGLSAPAKKTYQELGIKLG